VGENPVLEGWQVLGVIEHNSEGNLVKSFGGDLPEVYRTVDAKCDHCGRIRRRTKTVVLRSLKNGSYCQVGRSCLKDFTGHGDIELLASLLEDWYDLAGDDDTEFEPELRGSGWSCEVELPKFLGLTIRSIAESGWRSRSSDGIGLPTADRVWGAVLDGERATQDEIVEARRLLDIVQSALEEQPSLTDFEWNVRTVIQSNTVKSSTCGLAAAIVNMARRIENRQREDAARAASSPSQWLGEIGQRLTGLGQVTVTGVSELDSQFGITYLYKFVDGAGNVLTWFASSNQYIEPGETVVIQKATVKAHNSYRGINETVLTRCKLESS
jgi:hypothetical protein